MRTHRALPAALVCPAARACGSRITFNFARPPIRIATSVNLDRSGAAEQQHVLLFRAARPRSRWARRAIRSPGPPPTPSERVGRLPGEVRALAETVTRPPLRRAQDASSAPPSHRVRMRPLRAGASDQPMIHRAHHRTRVSTDPSSLPRHDRSETLPYVDRLSRYLAASDVAVVQGGAHHLHGTCRRQTAIP